MKHSYFTLQVIPDSNTTLVLSLHHPQAQMREIAVKHLGNLLNGKEVKVLNLILVVEYYDKMLITML